MPNFASWWGVAGSLAFIIAPLALPLILFGIFERIAPAGPQKSMKGWWLNLRLMIVYLSVPTLFGILIKNIVIFSETLSGKWSLDLNHIVFSVGLLSAFGGCVTGLLIWDFFYYWWHRTQHAMPFLWRIHCLHHMDDTLGVSANLRCHWLEEVGRTVVIFLPMGFLFHLWVQTGIVSIVLTFWGAFIHSNLRLRLGPLSPILAGPQVHRIHHSRLSWHHDRNFCAFFPIWDVIFGTYYHPAHDEFPPTGVDGLGEVSSVWDAIIMPFVSWRRFELSAPVNGSADARS